MLVSVADRLGAEGIVFRLQVGVAQQHAHALVEGIQLFVTEAAQLGRHVVELEALFEIVLAHQAELERGKIDVGEALADFLGLVAALLELLQVAGAELLLGRFAFCTRLVPNFCVEFPFFLVLGLVDLGRQLFLGLFEHGHHRVGQALGDQVAALAQYGIERR